MEFVTTKNKYIYKYFSINEFLLRNLINNELYFANPLIFNDPFDCQFKLNLIKGSKAEHELISKMQLSDKEKDLFEKANLRDNLADGFGIKLYEEIVKLLGVTCFTEHPDNFLMWSHYSNSHKGLCLKFDWKIHEEYFQGTKVNYDNKLPIAEYSSDEGFQQEIPKIVITKLEHWSYEDEVRSVVEIKNDKRNISFNPKALSGIIYGDKMAPKDKELVKRIVELHGEYQNLKFYQAKLNRSESKIKIDKV